MSETRYDWSNLSPDILRSILEGLTSKDFHRARAVCSNWYTVSTTCVRPLLYPWRVLFDEHSTYLFDPGEDNIYEIGHPELDLFKTNIMASCSNWLLIEDARLNFYLQNVFTRERINLPRIMSLLAVKEEWQFFPSEDSASCMWINERANDYVVAWSSIQGYLFSYKKGDDSWWSHQDIECEYMAYKDEKLYVYTFDRCIKILDLSSDLREEVVIGNPYPNHPFHIDSHPMSLVITSSGKVLIVVSFRGYNDDERSFNIYEMNLESGSWERVTSLAGEMMIFGQGVTIEPPIKDINGWGFKRDSICFGYDDLFPNKRDQFNYYYSKNTCGVFDIPTGTFTSLYVPCSKSFWFVPGYAKSTIARLLSTYS